MAMEELELTDAQAKALLESPSPLADVYRYFEKLETGYMDVIRDSIENRANDVCRAKEELRTTPVYPHSAAYAREHGELEQYRASNNANPVSYTHLMPVSRTVLDRNSPNRLPKSRFSNPRPWPSIRAIRTIYLMTVSYTHLDVYKRQPFSSITRQNQWLRSTPTIPV